MGLLNGRVAFVTGAARGQGRSHALRLAAEGADIIAVDVCSQIDSVRYPMSEPADLAETVRGVEALDRRIHAVEADVRDEAALRAAFDGGAAALGPVEIVVANAGIAPTALTESLTEWHQVIDVNLLGVCLTVQVAAPSMVAGGRGGSIVLTSSIAGLNGIGGTTIGAMAYTAAKHGVVGLMRSFANQLGPHRIRVNSLHPTGVATPMVANTAMEEFLASGRALPAAWVNALPVELVEARDISAAVVWLASEESRYVTGVTLPIDAGFTVRR